MVRFELLDVCAFPLLSSAEERCRGLGGKLLFGKEKSESGWQKHYSFGQANIVQELCINVEAAIMAWRNVLNCTYPGTKLFKSYPTF